jgi:hypothetical protein
MGEHKHKSTVIQWNVAEQLHVAAKRYVRAKKKKDKRRPKSAHNDGTGRASRTSSTSQRNKQVSGRRAQPACTAVFRGTTLDTASGGGPCAAAFFGLPLFFFGTVSIPQHSENVVRAARYVSEQCGRCGIRGQIWELQLSFVFFVNRLA